VLDKLRITVLAENSVPHKSRLLGQHGVSFWLEAKRGTGERRFLVDVGQHPDALLSNAAELGIPLGKTDAVVLTHCHYDHTGALVPILRAIGQEDLPVIAHPGLFRHNFVTAPFFQHLGMRNGNQPDEIRAAGGRLLLAKDALELMPGLSTSGEIPGVTDFEETVTARRTLDDAGHIVPDPMRDEIAVKAYIEDKGVVILTGCSHPGIVNILKHTTTPSEKILGIIGGLHLVDASDERIEKTVSALAGFNPALLATGHCTGKKAEAALSSRLGDRVTALGPGTVFEF